MSVSVTATAEATEQQPAEPLSGSAVLESLSASDREAWYRTGELPEPKPAEGATGDEVDEDEVEPVAEAKPAEAAAKPGDAKPAEAAKPLSKRQQQINDLIRKETEANQRASQLEAQIAELNARVSGKPAPVVEQLKPAIVPETRPRPTLEEFQAKPEIDDPYAAWMEELAEWKFEQRDAKRQAEAEATQIAQHSQQRAAGWAQRRDAYAAANSEFVTKAQSLLDQVYPGTPIGDVLMDSPIGPQLALHLAENPGEIDRIVRLAPLHQIRELGKLEAKIEQSASSPALAPAVAAAKTVTTAPAPPTTLGTKTADPADEVEAAVARGDFRAYAAAANQREIAAKR